MTKETVKSPMTANKTKAAIARGFHLFPFRTEKLNPAAPMVLRKWESRQPPPSEAGINPPIDPGLFFLPPGCPPLPLSPPRPPLPSSSFHSPLLCLQPYIACISTTLRQGGLVGGKVEMVTHRAEARSGEQTGLSAPEMTY